MTRPSGRATRAAVVLVLAVAVACGGDTPAPNAVGSTPATPTGATPTPTRSVDPPRPSSPRPTSNPSLKPPKQGVAPSATASAAAGTVVWLDRTCARRGKDVQALNAKTKPNGPVGFNTQYSDGSYYGDGTSQYSGGYTRAGNGFADANGNFRQAWTVPANAPLGTAAVRVVTQDGALEVTYRVVGATGSCP